MGQAVEQRGGHPGIAEDRGPFAEAEGRGDAAAGALGELARQMKEQRPAPGTEGQVSRLVQDHEVALGRALRDLAGPALGLFLFEGVDQFNGGEEADLSAVVLKRLGAGGPSEIKPVASKLVRSASAYTNRVGKEPCRGACTLRPAHCCLSSHGCRWEEGECDGARGLYRAVLTTGRRHLRPA